MRDLQIKTTISSQHMHKLKKAMAFDKQLGTGITCLFSGGMYKQSLFIPKMACENVK